MESSTRGDRRLPGALGDRPPAGTLGDRRLPARAGLALLRTNVRYWTAVAPIVRRELRHWERRAQAIPDPPLRALALEKLREEGFTAEAAAILATLAPRAHREHAVRAIVAVEVMYDYLDGLTERPSEDPLGDGARLFAAYTDAVTVEGRNAGVEDDSRRPGPDNPAKHAPARARDAAGDGGYLDALSQTASEALRRLPAAGAVTDAAQRAARRSSQAQTRMHATARLGNEQVEEWARREAQGTDLQWRELLAGAASSVISVHALIAAAANPGTTAEQARAIDRTYLSISALSTLLDSLVDYERDLSNGEAAFIERYDTPDQLADRLASIARSAIAGARRLPDGAHHTIAVVGVVAYFTSSPGRSGALARPIATGLHAQLRPLISPTLAVMHTWRLAKRVRNRVRNRRSRRLAGLASSPGKSHGIGGVQ